LTTTTTERELLTVGDAAKLAEVSADAVRQWERLGRLPVAARTAGGIRQFNRGDVEKMIEVRKSW